MADPREFERDLREFLEKEDNVRKGDKLQFLMALFNKHLEIDKIPHSITHHDLFNIVSGAKSEFTNQRLHVVISRKEVDKAEKVHVAVIDSFISYLNKNSLLKRPVQFDYTE